MRCEETGLFILMKGKHVCVLIPEIVIYMYSEKVSRFEIITVPFIADESCYVPFSREENE
jgi:hypothetical protein